MLQGRYPFWQDRDMRKKFGPSLIADALEAGKKEVAADKLKLLSKKAEQNGGLSYEDKKKADAALATLAGSSKVMAGLDRGDPVAIYDRDRATFSWEEREYMVDQARARVEKLPALSHLADKRRFDLFLELLNHIAAGHSFEEFFTSKDVTWSEVAVHYIAPELENLLREARQRAEDFRQMLREDAADARAIKGKPKKRYDKDGNLISEEIEYSDQLLVAQLKAGNPERYAERQKVEHQGVMLNVDLSAIKRETPKE